MRKLIDFMMTQPLLTGIVGIFVAMFSIHNCNTVGDALSEGTLRMLLSGTMAFFLYFVSREKTLRKCGVETGYVVKVFDAIIYQFRKFKYVWVLAAVVSSFIFGYVHVMYEPLNSPLMVGQVVGKTISTGLFGLASLFLYWKTRNIWACGLLHGLFDFLTCLPIILFEAPEIGDSSYAVQGEEGLSVIIIYAIDILINAIICIIIWKKIGKTMDFEEMRENW